ncbi:MAG TPA: peptide ABC transporter substrate-binding protein [Candidatus Saccharimonadales bacterium]|nr:peptide ABC transporter substrate-binding protein [Candidatus Saccharimonadales bacterium]
MTGLDDETKRRIRRRLRRRRKDAQALSLIADQKLERLFIRRFDSLVSVRRFVLLWICLFLLLALTGLMQTRALSQYYQSLQPVGGGLYTEGLVGTFTNADPLYATGTANTTVSKLVFSGLFKYDEGNKLVGDLAQSYSLSGDAQTHYTVHLKHGIKWQDGQPFTAEDVLYTYKTIQNIESQSPLYSSWIGVNVAKQDDYTVTFDLPNALSSFPYSLTNGIVPAHILKKVPVEQLRSASYNTAPIGTGPFEWKFTEVTGNSSEDREQRISLAAYNNYYAGRPKLDGFNLITYGDSQHMISAFQANQIAAMSGLETVPDELKNNKNIQVYVTPLTSEVMTFFNNSQVPLNNADIRRALIEDVDRSQLNNLFDEPVQPADSPLLKNQLGYDKSLVEPSYNPADANKILDQAGWVKDSHGMRKKNGQPLTFTLSAQDSTNYTKVAQFLQDEWAALGVKVQISYYSQEELQTSVVSNHDYDALLYGINIGVDPDVYAYWDSSQASITSQGHLNLSEYKSPAADLAIEGGRTRSDPAIRAVKYKAFLTQWVKDLPAMALYQPNYLYITHGPVFNYDRSAANSSTDRLYNVNNWMIRQKRQNIVR